jgi:hypothetical protein
MCTHLTYYGKGVILVTGIYGRDRDGRCVACYQPPPKKERPRP